nr:MAG TPA: hypothetical protein [Caudoviricetes sp.]
MIITKNDYSYKIVNILLCLQHIVFMTKETV